VLGPTEGEHLIRSDGSAYSGMITTFQLLVAVEPQLAGGSQ